jgi:hypothetical protein
MAKKNYFSDGFKSKLNRKKWEKLIAPMQYKVISRKAAVKKGIIPESIKNVNCVAIGASGSTDDAMMYFANVFRVDGSMIDQEPFVEFYPSGAADSLVHGFIHHSTHSGSRELLSASNIALIQASGSAANISFLAKPNANLGNLEDLAKEDKLFGFQHAHDVAKKKSKR